MNNSPVFPLRHFKKIPKGRVLKFEFMALFRAMLKRKRPAPPAPRLSEAELDKQLLKIGDHIKLHRQARTNMEKFSYEIKFSNSALSRCEAGGDMLLSSFLRILHGLGVKPEDFFKELK